MNEIIYADVIRTGPEWTEIIRADLGRMVEGIIDAGQHLIEAKADVNHGEWIPMLNGIGISRQHAHKLMQIGEQFSNVSYMSHLPSTMVALYELSQMDPNEIETGIESGDITPDTTAQDAKSLKTGKPKTPGIEKCRKNLKHFHKNATNGGLTMTELYAIVNEAEQMLDSIGRNKWKR